MQRELIAEPPSTDEFGMNPTFNVVIAYEDFETGKHAKKTYDYLAEHLGRDCRFGASPRQREPPDRVAVPAQQVIGPSQPEHHPEVERVSFVRG